MESTLGEPRPQCAHNLEKNEMKTYASMNQTDSAGDWRECGQCTAIGLAGNYCPNCEDTGMIFSEPVKTGRPMYEDMP